VTRIAYAASLALSAAILVSTAPPANAETYSVLFSFHNQPISEPQGRIFIHGSLFGTGSGCPGLGYGCYGDGQVFELTKSNGTWNSTAILKFDITNGGNPFGGLISDASGALYGTAQDGDAHSDGNVFKLTKSGNSWAHSTLYAFSGEGVDGRLPACDLVMDSTGNIYGTTANGGGPADAGTAFELSLVNGKWTETILHAFTGGVDGVEPYAGLLRDNSSALYGTTSGGGTSNNGTVFELKKSNGVWTKTVPYTFTGGNDGGYPLGILIEDSSGNLYGTTYGSGVYGYGTVFELSQSGGVWTEQTLYGFTGGADGGEPSGGLHWDGNYNTLVGTTQDGTVFKLSKSGGVWNESTLHTFGSGKDGLEPAGQIVRDSHGNLYGTTVRGGTYGNGTVWEITP
jgi:uncharacterized repeat protein (TIGR03803 family)